MPALEAYNQDVEQLHESVLKGIDRLERKRVYYAKKKQQKKNVSDVTTVTAPLTQAISFTFDDSQHGNSYAEKHEDRIAAFCEASREEMSLFIDRSEQKEEETTTKEVEIIMNGILQNPLLSRKRSGSSYPKSEDCKSECGSKKSESNLLLQLVGGTPLSLK